MVENRKNGSTLIIPKLGKVTEKEYDGYYYKISEVITIVILGCICGLRNLQQIHQWAVKERTSEFLKEEFGINRIPCYYWLTCILKIIKPESLNKCFENWVRSVMKCSPFVRQCGIIEVCQNQI